MESLQDPLMQELLWYYTESDADMGFSSSYEPLIKIIQMGYSESHEDPIQERMLTATTRHRRTYYRLKQCSNLTLATFQHYFLPQPQSPIKRLFAHELSSLLPFVYDEDSKDNPDIESLLARKANAKLSIILDDARSLLLKAVDEYRSTSKKPHERYCDRPIKKSPQTS